MVFFCLYLLRLIVGANKCVVGYVFPVKERINGGESDVAKRGT